MDWVLLFSGDRMVTAEEMKLIKSKVEIPLDKNYGHFYYINAAEDVMRPLAKQLGAEWRLFTNNRRIGLR